MAGKEFLDPRQVAFMEYFFEPKSETFGNCLQSALKAGYSDGYAEQLTSRLPNWLKESFDKLKRKGMLTKAEHNLFKLLDVDENDPRLVAIKADISKFVASRLGKAVYSERTELSGKDGEPINLKWNLIVNGDRKDNPDSQMATETPEQ